MLNLKLEIGKLSGSMLELTLSLLPASESVIPVIGQTVGDDPSPDTGMQMTFPTMSSSAKAASPPVPHALVPEGHANKPLDPA